MTEPLVPAEITLRRSIGMAIDPATYFTDPAYEFASAYAGYMALRLMIASWHQRPAGSLPSDDRALLRLARFGSMRAFKQSRDAILKGWILCTDNRLYHPLVAADVMRCAARMRPKSAGAPLKNGHDLFGGEPVDYDDKYSILRQKEPIK